jgi:hypothetical protein
MIREFTLDTPQSVIKALGLRGAPKDHFVLADSMADLGRGAPGIAPTTAYERDSDRPEWYGRITFDEACQLAIQGDVKLVAKSDKLLAKFERYAFETTGRGWRNDVVGALPDVPAYIAGHPLNMRRRTRLDSAAAPIAIVIDTTISAAIDSKTIMRRGAAILALVRILAGRRPVELWAVSQVGAKDSGCATVGARIDTTPLDLGTAAFALTHPGFPRRLCYSMARKYGFSGSWPYNRGGGESRDCMVDMLRPAMPHVTECLFMPGMHVEDSAANEPELWIEQKLAELMPHDLAA